MDKIFLNCDQEAIRDIPIQRKLVKLMLCHFRIHAKNNCLAALIEAFANDQWTGEHYTDEQAVEAVMDRFKRLVEERTCM